ncbi:MAG TPA: 1-phosphofructokinase [Bacillus sp. (in: firmicutes)]|uniref:1-phosphofructokinase n=1 Tax=Bacillus litorisediminis TaxID=2922713 RepID=UPI001FAD2127|nr:1-phosphofructokinase [Bacillus litorisediminis]HWO76643.1 1-phosphofructokinase [Bacillus sp. (in: firmicutes)]
MIYTCTLNPSIDYVVEIEEVIMGDLNRAQKTSFYPGGKGINVSRVLRNLGLPSTALGFAGGFTGKFIQDFLEHEGIQHSFVEHEEPTRVNIKLKTDEETEINGRGPQITEEQQKRLLEQIAAITPHDVLVLAGSLPPSLPVSFYEEVAAYCKNKEIPFVADTGGIVLKRLLSYNPILIKPNQHELGDLLHTKIHTIEDVLQNGEALLEQGPENIMVTLGGHGAVFMNKKVKAVATVPKGKLKNSVGAGDSTVAGFLAVYQQTGDVLEAFKTAVACGSATAFSDDLCTKAEVEHLLPQVQIHIIKK